MTPSTFIVAHGALLTRSHCDSQRNALILRAILSQCAQVPLAALSPTFLVRLQHAHCACATLISSILRPHQSIFHFRQLSARHNKNELQSHLPTIMMALLLRVLRYKSAMQSEKVSESDLVTGQKRNRVAMS